MHYLKFLVIATSVAVIVTSIVQTVGRCRLTWRLTVPAFSA
jgi:hypothetical protein